MFEFEKKTVWESYSAKDLKDLQSFAKGYISFMTQAKTEREFVRDAVKMAEKNGYKDIRTLSSVKAGDKVYCVNYEKTLFLFVIGKDPISRGLNLLGAHVDSPRIDLKQQPLYEANDLALLETHYYGGVKKYQWVALPLALHGTVIRQDGSRVEINIGEDDNDPVIGISDLLPHLGKDQMAKTMREGVTGENLNALVGTQPDPKAKKDAKDKVKANILAILNQKYGITEEDFISAELELVPAGPARDYGLDHSMIMAYGHDDRVCAYPSMMASFAVENPTRTTGCILVDKEEIGSMGATGMHSRAFENTIADLLELNGETCHKALRDALANSKMLSSDVAAAFDPNYADVNELNNTPFFNRGLVLEKYTGSGGKGGSNDANPEFIAEVRNVLNPAGVKWQTGELGKVDQGGGGTIAYILANLGMQVLDAGVAVQNMHAPFEVITKADLWEAYKGYVAFIRDIR
jgi:aspartyl aminopeptidase